MREDIYKPLSKSSKESTQKLLNDSYRPSGKWTLFEMKVLFYRHLGLHSEGNH